MIIGPLWRMPTGTFWYYELPDKLSHRQLQHSLYCKNANIQDYNAIDVRTMSNYCLSSFEWNKLLLSLIINASIRKLQCIRNCLLCGIKAKDTAKELHWSCTTVSLLLEVTSQVYPRLARIGKPTVEERLPVEQLSCSRGEKAGQWTHSFLFVGRALTPHDEQFRDHHHVVRSYRT